MYRIYSTIIALAVTFTATAQTAAVKKAAESIFTLTTFKADGTLLASSHGIFTSADGECASDLKPFVGAKRAVVTDAKGKRYDVVRMLGANEIYDVARFRINATVKPAQRAEAPVLAGASLWLLTGSGNAHKPLKMDVKSVEKFMEKYNYYIFSSQAPENAAACPVVNELGQVAGLLQFSSTTTEAYATDASYVCSLTVNPLAINSAPYSKIGIPAELPADKNQAMLALMMTRQSGDSLKYAATIADFQKAFPALTDGYVAQAQLDVDNNRLGRAAEQMELMKKRAETKDDAHYNCAKLIFAKMQYDPQPAPAPWTYDNAIDEAQAAYAAKPLPLYKDIEAQIRYAKGEYQQAYDIFMQLTKTNFKNPDLYYNAALCRQQLKAPDTEIVELLDSAASNVDSLNIAQSAKYFLMRGDTYNRMKNYRQAVFDYTRYEILSGRNVNATFYYVRHQAEVNAKLYKQALVDIDNAIFLDPKEPVYQAEKASLQLRLNMFQEAIDTATKCIQAAPEFSDTYLVLGLAQIKTGKKADGVENLRKAGQMGNTQAAALIEKYGK